ncbi:hypothetical protein QBC44DRAFT_209437, partial [Cladorrhinum sp. PSN332]
TDSMPIGKVNFLRCYAKAREKQLTAFQINRGWRSTGIYPKNRLKALRSQYVKTESEPSTLQRAHHGINNGLNIPNSSFEIRKMLSDFTVTTAQRYVLRAIGKEMDQHRVEKMILKKRIEDLTQQVDDLRARKRRKVEAKGPNDKFVSGKDIFLTKEGLEAEERIKKYMVKPEPAPARRSARKRIISRKALEADNVDEESD